jgi:hypothetical protein
MTFLLVENRVQRYIIQSAGNIFHNILMQLCYPILPVEDFFISLPLFLLIIYA